MKVRLTIHRPVTDKKGHTFQAGPGDVVDFPDEQAVRLIQSGQGEAVAEVAEAAVTKTDEQAVLPPAGKKGKR